MEPGKVFKNLEIREDVIDKLRKKESDTLEKIQNLYVSLNMLDRKFSRGYIKLQNLNYDIDWRLKELESLKLSLYDVYEKPIKQIVELQKGIRHGSTKDLVKERQLFKRIKQAREEAIRLETNPTKISIRWGETLDTKEAVKELIEVRSNELEEMRIRRVKFWEHGRLDIKKAAIEKDIAILKTKLEDIRRMKVEASKSTT
ncbi:uncharacterized protein LOC141723305 [Apium graveolens]|uniref:uncharacterized protein LOC141723305 n=1 Tax=Apium graveolens TaxID=4045 RepID=UPI003D7ADE65